MYRIDRRTFLTYAGFAAGTLALLPSCFPLVSGDKPALPRVKLSEPSAGEDIFSYINRINGEFNITLYRQITGAANEFKEGDEAQGLAAIDDESRTYARILLRNTKLQDLYNQPLFIDDLLTLIHNTTDQRIFESIAGWTLSELKGHVLNAPQQEIKAIMPGLSSDITGCLVKIMSNDELIAAGKRIFNPLPGSNIGAEGYMGARIQPNSPTDHPDDIMMQVFNGWAFAVGDVVLGTNPVSSDPESVAAIEQLLHHILKVFGLEDVMPGCVLAHIDIQAEVEKLYPGTTGIWFQSLGGTVNANRTFDLTIDKMMDHAAARTGRYGMYFETGQGADFTNGSGEGFDIVVHESRKYGFARALKQKIAEVQLPGFPGQWVHLNDVAGFIGPEVFRSKEQLVRCCLEDTVMGKLHGLTIGLDICSTLHMDVSLDDLEWCIDQVMPANPAYLMALPTKNDPMLSYLTTGFNDHVRVREKFGYKVNDAMWEFFKRIEIIDDSGNITSHFGDPVWVYYQYRLAMNDSRSREEIFTEGNRLVKEVEERGVPLARGYGRNIWDLEPGLDRKIHALYEDSKKCIWEEWPEPFITSVPSAVILETTSTDRNDYICHPPTGEVLSEKSVKKLNRLKKNWSANIPDIQIIISDGLSVNAITDEGHLYPFLETLRNEFEALGLRLSANHLVIRNGRVRAGYRAGEFLFGDAPEGRQNRGIIHIIGERPGSGHHNFSAYLSAPPASIWNNRGTLDHNHSRVVSGISDTALTPDKAARETVKIMLELMQPA